MPNGDRTYTNCSALAREKTAIPLIASFSLWLTEPGSLNHPNEIDQTSLTVLTGIHRFVLHQPYIEFGFAAKERVFSTAFQSAMLRIVFSCPLNLCSWNTLN